MQRTRRTRAAGHATVLHQLACSLLVGVALSLSPSLSAQQQRDEARQEVKWETLRGCRLVTNAVVDGDSFHVLYQDREYIFRLYFVDSPESDPTLKERIKDQSAYFGVPAEDIPRAGQLASQFTRRTLEPRRFTVITRWQNGLGRSSLARFYGIVLVDELNLAEALATNGLARIYGIRANWPDGPRSTTFINKLKNLELAAREQKAGIWDKSQFARTSDAPRTNPAVATDAPPPIPSTIDLNNASYEQLLKLPGIGPKLAERIIAQRPYKTIEDLDKVSGIGKATIERLRPLVSIESRP